VDASGRPLHSWRTLILPYLEQAALYQSIDLSKPWNDPANARALQSCPNTYRCPDETGPKTTTTYLASAAPNGCFPLNEPRRLSEITDGTASTLAVIEVGDENAVPWMAPVDADESLVLKLVSNAKTHHSGGANALLVDGSVRYLKTTIQASVLRALISVSGDEKVDNDMW
jgi:prepilin-type processing-associated H-X9-DG protein